MTLRLPKAEPNLMPCYVFTVKIGELVVQLMSWLMPGWHSRRCRPCLQDLDSPPGRSLAEQQHPGLAAAPISSLRR